MDQVDEMDQVDRIAPVHYVNSVHYVHRTFLAPSPHEVGAPLAMTRGVTCPVDAIRHIFLVPLDNAYTCRR